MFPKLAKYGFFLLELFVVSLAFFLTYYLLQDPNAFYRLDIIPGKKVLSGLQPFEWYLQVYLVSLIIWAFLLGMHRPESRDFRIRTKRAAGFEMLKSGLFFFAFFSSAAFLMKFHFLSRFFILSYSVLSTVFLTATRLGIMAFIKRLRKQGFNRKNILLVGTGRRAQEFLSLLAKHQEWGYSVVGLLDGESNKRGELIAGHPVMGALEDMPAILERTTVDEVVFVTPRSWLDRINGCLLYCEAVGVPATVSTDLFDLEIASGNPKKVEGKTYLTFETRILHGSELFVKRIFDILTASIVLLLSFPVLLIVAASIKLTSPGPVFFTQTRVGRYGRLFKLYKFRSMVTNAEQLLKEMKIENEMSGPVFKATRDPRITPVGRFLRKTSLDEFPQFWNVLKGDMSVVGPRPPLPSEVAQYEPWQRRRLSMQPGITCLWQVKARNQTNFEKWMEFDLNYIDNWSLVFDFKILLLTAGAVFSASGK